MAKCIIYHFRLASIQKTRDTKAQLEIHFCPQVAEVLLVLQQPLCNMPSNTVESGQELTAFVHTGIVLWCTLYFSTLAV